MPDNTRIMDKGRIIYREMKRKPVFKKIFIESGHPDHAVNDVTEQLEDNGFDIEFRNSSNSSDNTIEGVKKYGENIKATRKEKNYRKNAGTYKQWFQISIVFSVLFLIISFNNSLSLLPALVFIIATAIFYSLSQPKIKRDIIWIKVDGKIYSGTKSRELKDKGKDRGGTTKVSSSVYVHSELTFSIAGDSEIEVKRVREI